MTYQQYGLIQASDYNSFVGATSGETGANKLNTVLGVGNGNAGYGQSTVSNVVIDSIVQASNWATLINTYSSIGNHQQTAITATTTPSAGAKIEILSPISTNLTNIYTNRLNAAAQGTTSSTSVTNNTTWATAITFTHTVTFSSGDAARYFFNAGGQIALTFSHPTGTGINPLWNSLCTACGTIVLSSINSGSITVASTSYNGVTKIGGTGTPSVLNANIGYYGLTTSYQQVFRQLASSGLSKYLSSYISVSAKNNGTNLSGNGDNGSVISIQVIFDQVPDGGSYVITSSGSTSSVTMRPPSSTYLTNTWGTPTVTGTVA